RMMPRRCMKSPSRPSVAFKAGFKFLDCVLGPNPETKFARLEMLDSLSSVPNNPDAHRLMGELGIVTEQNKGLFRVGLFDTTSRPIRFAFLLLTRGPDPEPYDVSLAL